MTLLTSRLPFLIDAALAALACDRSGLALTLAEHGAGARVVLGSQVFDFGNDPFDDMLAWELLVDALPGAVEHARLVSMHDAVGAAWAAPWSVYTTSTALAWLTWASGGAGTPLWRHNLDMILSAAEYDGGVAITAAAATSSAMSGVLRSRQLMGLIRMGPRSHYMVAQRQMLAKDIVPATNAMALAGCDAAAVIDASWLVGWNVKVADASVSNSGTLLVLKERMVPLEAIPAVAAEAAPRGCPPHAPWIVTEAERAAVDAIDHSTRHSE